MNLVALSMCELARRHGGSDLVMRIPDGRGTGDVLVQGVDRLLGNRDEIGRLLGAHRVVQSVRRRHRPDENEHDKAHALLPVIGAVRKADSRAGADEQQADPPRRRFRALRSRVKRRVLQDQLRNQQQRRRAEEADDRRNEQRLAHIGGLAPIHSCRYEPTSTGSRFPPDPARLAG